jgi:hypothetical protein
MFTEKDFDEFESAMSAKARAEARHLSSQATLRRGGCVCFVLLGVGGLSLLGGEGISLATGGMYAAQEAEKTVAAILAQNREQNREDLRAMLAATTIHSTVTGEVSVKDGGTVHVIGQAPAGRRKTRPVCGVGVEQDVPCPPRRKWPGFRSRVGRGFGGRPGEKTVFQVLARPQQGKGCLDRGDLTPLADPLLRGRPSSTVQIDCILNQNDAHFPQAVGRPGQPKGPAAAVAPSPLHLAGCGRWSILIISDWAVRCATLSSDARRADATQIDGRLLRTGIASRPDARSMVLCLS